MSGAAACITGATLTDPTMCAVLNAASMDALSSPAFLPPVSVTNAMLPPTLQTAITECTGSDTCKLIGYDFDTNTAVKATGSNYVVDTYSSTAENSGVLVTKGIRTTGIISGITADAVNGGSTGTVTYTGSDGQSYTFQARWKSVQVNGTYVDVYFDPGNVSQGALTNDNIGVNPVKFIQPPGYELPDFQATVVTSANSLGKPTVSSVEECAAQCDTTTGCKGFNFGGIDSSTICELVNNTGTRVYADNKSGFVKETISSTQTGDGSNPTGTDLGNIGQYCKEATQCNSDISKTITSNESATNPIAAFSTAAIESCAYCPIRAYNKTGHVTTNEIGISKTNATAQAAITSLQYSTDGSDATHVTITAGNWYRMSSYIASNPGGRYDAIFSPIATSVDNVFQLYFLKDGKFFVATNSAYVGNQTIGSFEGAPSQFQFTPVDYVTDGFIMSIDGIQRTLVYYASYTYKDSTVDGMGNVVYLNLTAPSFWHIENVSAPRFSDTYNKSIFTISSVSTDTIFNTIITGSVLVNFTEKDDNGNEYIGFTSSTFTRPPVFINSRNEIFKLENINSSLVLRKFADDTMLAWYVEFNPSWYGPYLYIYNKPYTKDNSGAYTRFTNPLNKLDDSNPIWTNATIGSDMPDPYEALGQFRAFDIAPPTTAQQWSYDRRQGCDRNCGSTPNGYAIYSCRGAGGGNCDPGQGASVSGPVCSDTHISCRPADDSNDLKEQFSHKITGFSPASAKVISGGTATTHNTDALRIRTIYRADYWNNTQLTPETKTLLDNNSIFPSWVKSRIPWQVSCTRPNSSQFVTNLCTSTSDTQFGTLTSCPSGQYLTGFNQGSTTTQTGYNGTCTPCTSGSYCPGGIYPVRCTVCNTLQSTGLYASTACSTTTDTVCSACTVGVNYCPGDDIAHQCTATSTCSTGVASACSISADLICNGLCICNSGYSPFRPPVNSGYGMQCCATGTTLWGYDMMDLGICGVVDAASHATWSYPQACRCPPERTGTSCNMCATNYVWNGTNACVQCLNGGTATSASASGNPRTCTCQTGYTGSTCSSCDTGYVWDGTRCIACVNGAGTGANACSTCATGYTGLTCSTCATGYTGSTCSTCDANYVWNGSMCVQCLNGGTATSASASGNPRTCTCQTGYTGSTCSSCATGYYGASCTRCTEPTRRTDYVTIACGANDTSIATRQSCPLGQVVSGFSQGSSTTAGAAGSCVSCLGGFYCPDMFTQTRCTVCNTLQSTGLYASTACSSSADTVCTACTLGTNYCPGDDKSYPCSSSSTCSTGVAINCSLYGNLICNASCNCNKPGYSSGYTPFQAPVDSGFGLVCCPTGTTNWSYYGSPCMVPGKVGGQLGYTCDTKMFIVS